MYGTDITGQILALVLFSIFFELIKKENLNKFNREKKYLLIHFNVYLSDFDKNIFYDLLDITDYSCLSFRHQKINDKKKFFSKSSIIFKLIDFYDDNNKYFSNWMPQPYPITSLCFQTLFVRFKKLNTVQYLSNWYEIWSKAGAGQDFRVSRP